MTSEEIRQSFIDFFKERGHTVVPSAPVVPHGDPTLLFTNAGMNQFKDVFLGTGSRPFSRAVDTQKCIRVSGKHNDLEEVGHDTYHHTFFEMLGNWSFGDYYKEEAITWAWELLTKVWGLPKERLHATVYRAEDGSARDQEAYDIWKDKTDIDPTHIHWFGAKDNFWEMGETGPCGPCSEIHFDRTPDGDGGGMVNAGVQEVIEIWNLVFIQFNRRGDGSLEELPSRHVDTGMGFERACAVIQGKESNYDTDVFAPLLKEIEKLSGGTYVDDLHDRPSTAMRVIADHVRALSFAIADGAAPGNTGRGYVLRRLLRRAIKYAFLDLNLKQPILYKLVGVIADTMGGVFPEVVAQRTYIAKVILAEEENFGARLEQGIERFEKIAAELPEEGKGRVFPGSEAFLLFDTFGFPLDLTELLAREQGIEVDTAGFNQRMGEQRQRARDARKSVSQEASELQFTETTEFVGYTENSAEATVVGKSAEGLILDRTPFYAEMGGQLSDTGEIIVNGERYEVSGVQKIGGAFLHIVTNEDIEVTDGQTAVATIDVARRAEIQRNHSATHILHEVLRRVLGTHVQQAGSLVTPGHLRFDFSHFSRLKDEQLADVEQAVNAKLREGIMVVTEELPIEEARKIPNVKMFFGDKYGSSVRVVTMDPSFSVEFCGGTHVRNTSDIGLFKLTSESSVQSGVRRIEAATGRTADELLFGRYRQIEQLSKRLGTSDGELLNRVEGLLEEKKNLEKELSAVRLNESANILDEYLAKSQEVNGVRIVSGEVAANDLEALKQLGDTLRNRLKSRGIGVLGANVEGKAMFVCVVTDDLTGEYQAGKIVSELAKRVGGGGGGKPHMATPGGKDLARLKEALASVATLIA